MIRTSIWRNDHIVLKLSAIVLIRPSIDNNQLSRLMPLLYLNTKVYIVHEKLQLNKVSLENCYGTGGCIFNIDIIRHKVFKIKKNSFKKKIFIFSYLFFFFSFTT